MVGVASDVQALHDVLPKLARCRKPSDVGGVAIDGIRTAFATHVCCSIFLDDAWDVSERTLYGCKDADFDDWDRDWRNDDRVFPAVLARAAPVHIGQVYPPGGWLRAPVYTQYAKRLRIEQYMSAPIFGSRGLLVGAVNFCRRLDDLPFDERSLALASKFSGFLSATLARVQEAPVSEENPFAKRLSGREIQVARLAASGRSNPEIALRLGVARETVKQTLRRVYRKMDANGRAEMAAKLAAHGLLSPKS